MKTLKMLLAGALFISIFFTSCEKAVVANFNYTQTAGGTVTFINTSSHASSYGWNFGDGPYSSETSPTHTYSNLGTYTITLTAYSDGGNGTNTQKITAY